MRHDKRPAPPPNTCVIYCRVSTDAQEREGTSLDSQEADCRTYASAQGWTVAAALRDTASGGTLDRPGLDRARDMLEEGRAGILLAYSLDRLSRHQHQMGVVCYHAERVGARVVAVREQYEDSAIGRFLANSVTFAGEFEREKIRDRTMRGRRAKVNAGRYSGAGMAPYGYNRDRANGVLTIREDEAAVVRRIYQWAGEGLSITGIWRRLNTEGVPSPAQSKVRVNSQGPDRRTYWMSHTVGRILHDPSYRGDGYAYRLMVTEINGRSEPAPPERWVRLPDGVCPAILPTDLWDRVQRRLSNNTGARTRNERRPYLLRGLIRCGACGRSMTPEANKRWPVYRCASRASKDGRCGAPGVSAAGCEAEVWQAVKRVLGPGVLEAEIARQQQAGPDPAVAAEIEAARAELARTEARRRFLRERLGGELSAEVWEATAAAIDAAAAEHARLTAALRALEALAAGHQVALARVESIREHCRSVAGNLDSLAFADRRHALESLEVSVVMDGQTPRVRLGLPSELCGILTPPSSAPGQTAVDAGVVTFALPTA